MEELTLIRIKDDEGDYLFYTDANDDIINKTLELLKMCDWYDYDCLKKILSILGFNTKEYTEQVIR